MNKLICCVLIFGLVAEMVVCKTFRPEYSGLYSYHYNPYMSRFLSANEPIEEQKRAYMRLGKRAYMRLGKRGDAAADDVDGALSEEVIPNQPEEDKVDKRARLRLG